MKISSIGSYTNYYNNKSNKKVSKNNDGKKYDSVKISKGNNNNYTENESSFDITKLKQKLTDEATQSLSEDRIEEIRKQIKENAYDVNTTELANIILQI